MSRKKNKKTNEKLSKENEKLKKEIININSQLQQSKDEIAKKVKETNYLKELTKIMNKEQIKKKQKAISERENSQNIIKDLKKAKRELEKHKIKKNKP